MLSFLFRGLTSDTERGARLFAAVTRIARKPHWFMEGEVPDTLDGRFAALATVTALVLVRFESESEAGNAMSVALTERFIEVMESEHRELGLGDPTLGKTVRKLVGSLARRTELWRETIAGEGAWETAARKSLYRGEASPGALGHSTRALRNLWAMLERVGLTEIGQGEL